MNEQQFKQKLLKSKLGQFLYFNMNLYFDSLVIQRNEHNIKRFLILNLNETLVFFFPLFS